jgi:hypothetical protein
VYSDLFGVPFPVMDRLVEKRKEKIKNFQVSKIIELFTNFVSPFCFTVGNFANNT